MEDGKRYYHIKAQREHIPDPYTVADEELADLLDLTDVRQAVHISYGGIFNEMEGGKHIFRDRVYACLNKNRECLNKTITEHIRHHLQVLGKVPTFGEARPLTLK